MMRSPETLQGGRRVKRASRPAAASAARWSRSAGVIGSYEEESAGWEQYADAVVEAIDDRRAVVVVGHSLGGLRRRWCAFAFPSTCSSSWWR